MTSQKTQVTDAGKVFLRRLLSSSDTYVYGGGTVPTVQLVGWKPGPHEGSKRVPVGCRNCGMLIIPIILYSLFSNFAPEAASEGLCLHKHIQYILQTVGLSL